MPVPNANKWTIWRTPPIHLDHQQVSDPTPVSLNFNRAGHSINDVILIPLELIRGNRDAVGKTREAHLIHKGNTISPLEINRRDEAQWYMIPTSLLCPNNNLLSLLSHFQIPICNELLVLFSFFFWPLKKVCFQTEILANLFKYIYFCGILLITSSSPCRKDQFAVSYVSKRLIALIQVYNREIRHHSLVCCCGLADILYIFKCC